MGDSTFVQHEPCPSCGSKDNLARYDDGHGTCFGCGAYFHGDGSINQRREKVIGDFLEGEYQALGRRHISEDTCRKFGYRVVQKDGRTVQVADYRATDGTLVAQKVRSVDKKFSIIGNGKDMPLFGQHLWAEGGKRVVVTEGEIDAMSVAQVFNLTWPVVSLPNGAHSAKKAIANASEWLSTFGDVVLMFDMDEPGREAAAEVAQLLPPGKVKIAELPAKDANELLQAGHVKDITTAVYQARIYRPGGIVNGADLWDAITKVQEPGWPYPWAGLTEMTGGQKPRSLVTWTAGTGTGKSTLVAAVAYDLAFKQGHTVGYVALEESVGRAAQRFLSAHLGKRVHLPGAATPEELRRAFDETLGTGRLWLHDHFGSVESDSLIGKLRYLAKGCGCTVLVVDHLSIIVSGMSLDGDERRMIDHTMTSLRTLVEETGVLLHLVSHLRRAGNDQGHEEGARVTLAQLRGSQAIAQLSDCVIGVERDLQAPDGVSTVRVLKNRETGDTGVAGKLVYDWDSGRLEEADEMRTEEADDDGIPF